MTRFADILDDFSNADLSEALGIDESHARTMKVRDSVPPEYWPPLLAAAEAKGKLLTPGMLMEASQINAAERAEKRAAKRARTERAA